MIAAAMPVSVFAGRIDRETEEQDVPEITEPEEKEPSKPVAKETKPAEKEPEEDKKPESQEPAEKEPEAPKEAEETETKTPEETDKTDPKTPEKSGSSDEKAPNVSTDAEKATAKTPGKKVSGKAKKAADFDNDSLKFSNGMLTWPAIDNAAKYRICLPSSDDAFTANTEFDICSFIDSQIEKRAIFKDNRFEVWVIAVDSNDIEFAGTHTMITYNTSAEPKTTLPEIQNAKISSNGILSWDAYSHASGLEAYYIRIIGSRYASEYAMPTDTSFDLKNYIPTIISKDFKEEATYKIQVVALEAGSYDPVAESGFFTYNYKKANTMTVTAKKAAKVKARKVKKKNQYVKSSKIMTIKKAVGKLTFTKVSGNSKITINRTSGKITVKKKTKKGTYAIRVLVRAAGNSSYIAAEKTVTVKIKVK